MINKIIIMKLYKFCSANSFKSRSKLTEFYKLTHPDVLHNAPVYILMNRKK